MIVQKKLQTPQPTTADQDMFASITCDPHLDEERRSHTKYTHAIMIMPAPQQLTPQKQRALFTVTPVEERYHPAHTNQPPNKAASQHTQPTTTNKSTLAHY